mgnify:CR=1 FL=1|jgi:hypothetical protein
MPSLFFAGFAISASRCSYHFPLVFLRITEYDNQYISYHKNDISSPLVCFVIASCLLC